MNRKIMKYVFTILFCLTGIWGALRSVPAAAEDEKYVIVLDPGHGGSEAGAGETFNGVAYNEEEITWKIATFCKEELSKYPNIEVHLTRDVEYMSMGISDRVKVAYDYNADLLVSMHIDSTDSPSISGASLLISNGNYRTELAEKELLLSRKLQAEFAKIGLPWRGNVVRNSENGSTYPNGLARDYYGIVAGSIEMNLPGVIVEHCFVTNYSDVMNFLSSDEKIRRLAIADANAIVEYCKEVEKVPARDGWSVVDGGGYVYYLNGAMLKNKVFMVSGKTYAVDENGLRVGGWFDINGKTFYFDRETGEGVKGWMTLNKKRYYFSSTSGSMFKDMLVVNEKSGVTRYFKADGSLAVNQLVTYDGDTYYMNENGQAVRGFRTLRGKTYFFSMKDSKMVTSTKISSSDGRTYYLCEDGTVVRSRFVTLQEGEKQNTYYFGRNGMAYKGWQTINGKRYCFSPSGIMAKNQSLMNARGKIYVFDEHGVLIETKEAAK